MTKTKGSKTSSDQSDRFKEAARKAGADESDDAIDRAFGKLDLRHKPEPESNPEAPDKGE